MSNDNLFRLDETESLPHELSHKDSVITNTPAPVGTTDPAVLAEDTAAAEMPTVEEEAITEEAPTAEEAPAAEAVTHFLSVEDAPIGIAVSPSDPEAETPQADAVAPIAAPSKKRHFCRFLLIYTLIGLLLIAGGLFAFRAFMVRYEAATPTAALERYLDCIREKDYTTIFTSSGFEETLLNSKDEYFRYLERLYGRAGDDLTLREKPSGDDSFTLYSLYDGDTRLSTLMLTRSPEGNGKGWVVTTQLDYQEEYTLTAAEDVTVSINGMDLSLLGLPTEPVQNTLFPQLAEDATIPTVNCYRLSGLLNPPVITANTLSGNACEIQADGKNDHALSVVRPLGELDRLTAENLAETVATTYAAFVAQDASRTKLLNYVYPKCEFYTAVRNFSNAFFTRHDSYTFEDLKVENLYQITDSDFRCTVSFHPTYMRNGKKLESESAHYTMSFVKVDEQWLLYALAQGVTETGSPDSTETPTAP